MIDTGNDYLIKVKRNQPKLYYAIEQQTKDCLPVATYQSQEKSRDRVTHRQVEIFTPPSHLDPAWIGISCVIRVERCGTRNSFPYRSLSYYIGSMSPRSRQLVAGIRGHWCIDNRLHWVKDVITGEDTSPQKSGFAPLNFSILKTWMLTQLRALAYDSITEAVESIRHNLPFLLSICS